MSQLLNLKRNERRRKKNRANTRLKHKRGYVHYQLKLQHQSTKVIIIKIIKTDNISII